MLTIKNTRKAKPYLKPGIYDAECISIGMHPDYADDAAILVEYALTDETGRLFDFREVFYNNSYNERSGDFFDYLEKNKISLDNVEKFIGCTERVTLKKLVRSNRSMLSIVAREFVAHAAGDDSAI